VPLGFGEIERSAVILARMDLVEHDASRWRSASFEPQLSGAAEPRTRAAVFTRGDWL
jgi:hypothetical protein